WGRTTLRKLIALGEVGHTGLHGSNRLASNSLLEAVVFSHRAAQKIEKEASLMDEPIVEPAPWDEGRVEALKEAVIIDHDWDAARRIMWDYVGIVRTDERLRLAAERIEQLKSTVESLYWGSRLTQDLLELRNIILVGELVIRSARERRESRGLHFTESHPQRDDEHFGHDTFLRYGGGGTS
ncbi:MAG: L-aspartate oxidase, partial [bacterium]|nr:L-aspartate oxidase [bacterium]